jgi:hypothetical protein
LYGGAKRDFKEVRIGPILLKKSKVEPRRKTVDMTSKSEIDSNYYCKSQFPQRTHLGKRLGRCIERWQDLHTSGGGRQRPYSRCDRPTALARRIALGFVGHVFKYEVARQLRQRYRRGWLLKDTNGADY